LDYEDDAGFAFGPKSCLRRREFIILNISRRLVIAADGSSIELINKRQNIQNQTLLRILALLILFPPDQILMQMN
jgi:hypothetical protein